MTALLLELLSCYQIDWLSLFRDLVGSDLISGGTWIDIPADGYAEKLSKLIKSEPKM